MFVAFLLIVLIFSIMIHEVSHGIAAYKLGDDTAKLMGRLNLNPLKHIDPVGSILLPLFLVLTHSPVLFGWAKPVPFNPNNLKDPRRGAAIIAGAGPLSNLFIAVFFGLLGRLIPLEATTRELLILTAPAGKIELITSPAEALFFAFMVIIFINTLLAIFNLVPIPPLDGSKILFAFIPARYYGAHEFLERYGLFVLLLFIFFGIGLITPIIYSSYGLIAGY